MRKLIVIAALAAVGLSGPVPASASDAPIPVTVMARNLYLGSDVGVALDLLPDLDAAGQFMWDEVQATNFTARAPKLAQEAVEFKPDVIGLQEATTWNCRTGLFGGQVAVYDFTRDFLKATEDAGVPYVVASAQGQEAYNPGYSIGPIPLLTTVRDPATFQPLFGSDTAECGFQLSDALLVRADLADSVIRVGTTEFVNRHTIIPVVFEVDRGFAWADLELQGSPVRFVTTHLESMWPVDGQNAGAQQARQLVGDLDSTQIPVILMGDINNDPRDPRPIGAPNPAGQPTEGKVCDPQVPNPTPETAKAQCNAYWSIVQGGYTDAGPDAMDPRYYTWGTDALLAGPDPRRVQDALAMGNDYGWTDRLDYVLVKNGVEVKRAVEIGTNWSDSDRNWICDAPDQVANTEAMSKVLADAGIGEAISGKGVCLPSDHGGIVADLLVTPAAQDAAAPIPPTHEPAFNSAALAIAAILWTLLGVVALAAAGVIVLIRRLVRGRRSA